MNVGKKLGPSSENTRSAILDLIRSSGTVSRLELSAMSGLTPTSISRMVKSLIEAGLVIETGLGDSTGGKRPSLLELNPTARYAIGLSLDESQLTYVVTDFEGNVVSQLVSLGIGGQSPIDVMQRVASEIAQFIRELHIPPADVVGVGVAGAGLDIGSGAERLSLTSNDWESFAVRETLEASTGLPVVRDNDAACAALGQFWVGRIPATQDFATLYMAGGFGLGLVTNGVLSRGSSSNVGEIGHIVLDIDGPDCWCGSRGCLEMLAAPRAVVAHALEHQSVIEDLGLLGTDDSVRSDFDAITRAAADGDERCVRLVEDSARYIAVAVLSVVNLLDPDRVYLAGPGFAHAGAIYLSTIRAVVAQHARTRAVHPVSIELSDPAINAAAVGAATLVLQHVLTPHTRSRVNQ